MTKISLSEFRDEVKNGRFMADINSLLGVCGASPVRVSYEAEQIIVSETYPESILLVSGKTHVLISQIIEIRKDDNTDSIYFEIECGILYSLRQTIIIKKV